MKISKIKVSVLLSVMFIFGTVFIVHADTASTTDTGTETPSAVNTRVIPILRPSKPIIIVTPL